VAKKGIYFVEGKKKDKKIKQEGSQKITI
jgi:hypothetical protein